MQPIHTYNEVFLDNYYMDPLAHTRQEIRFSGTGDSHQNTVSKISIKTIVYMARKMLINAAMKITEGIVSAELWQTDMHHSVCMYNHMPNVDIGLSPHDIWTRSKLSCTRYVLGRFHT